MSMQIAIHPLKHGRFETGARVRFRDIPTDMKFYPGINSPLDVDAGGYANYQEIIPAITAIMFLKVNTWKQKLVFG